MKYIRTYENIISKLFPRYKLANALVKFLNEIDPSLNCFIEPSLYDGINIVSNKLKSDVFAGYLITISKKKYSSQEFGSDETIAEITIHSIHKSFKDISEFLEELFDLDIDLKYIDSYIEKLTEENYKDYLIKKDVNKYNI